MPTGRVTFLFTDIEGSTRLLQRLGTEYAEVLARQRSLLRHSAQSAGGTVVDAVGDGFFAAFASPQDAVSAAVSAMRALSDHPWPRGGQVRIRAGLHGGQASVVDDGYVGLDVHRVARICASGHGGQILVSETVRTEVSEGTEFSFKDLGRHRLKDIDDPEHLYQVVAPGLLQDFPPLSTVEARPHNLPSELTEFIGRESEVDEIRSLLSGARLVTLLGAGGIGKTRTALHVAAELLPEFSDGVFHAPLESVQVAEDVPAAIGKILRVSEADGRSMLEMLKDYLESRAMLLVLDNFEQVIPAGQQVSELLTHAPSLKVLATSRTPLAVRGEQVFRMPPLQIPDRSGPQEVETVQRIEAVELFVRRARGVDPSFELTPENAPAVIEIVRRLDGLPLAIELAAATLRILPVPALNQKLQESFEVLGTGPQDLPARHQTVRGTVAWSYQLLESEAQAAFRTLSVFVGGFSLDAAESMLAGGGRALERLTALYDQSLLQQTTTLGELRFSMLESIREFAFGELQAADEAEDAMTSLVAFLQEISEDSEPALNRLQNTGVIDRLTLEIDNIRAALRFCLENLRIEPGLQICTALWRYWHAIGQLQEGRQWLEKFLAFATSSDRRRADALVALAGLAYWQSDYSFALARYEEALEIYEDLGAEYQRADTKLSMSTSLTWSGEVEAGERLADEAIEAFGQIGARDKVGMGLMAKGFAKWVSGDLVHALPLWTESLEIAEDVGDLFEAATKRLAIASMTLQRGDMQSALEGARLALRELYRLKHVSYTIMAMDWVAALAAHKWPEDSLLLAGAADRLRLEFGGGPRPEASGVDSARTVAERSLEADTISDLWSKGRGMGLDQAYQFAHELASRSFPT